jgi:tRNA A37 methylthiotransferase MiaB
MKKFHIATLGCRTNQYESQAFTDQLRTLGGVPVVADEEADLCIVNTCTVTEGADRSSRQEIRALLRNHPNARIAVTGCMAESAPAAHLSEKMSFALRQSYVGREMSVLVEGDQTGHTENFLSVQILKSDAKPHDIRSVQLIDNGPMGLVGVPCV